MKWEVSGAWKTNGQDATLVLDAPDGATAEKIASEWGMMVERSAEVKPVQVVAPAPTPPTMPKKPLEEAYGLTRKMAAAAIIGGLFCTPMLFGVPLLIWGFVADMKMNRIAQAAKLQHQL